MYLHKDYLGSVLAISDQAANILEQRSFDAWGSLTHLKTKNGLFTSQQAIINEILNNGLILDRGYTGHEHLWAVGIINMNGRLYDPALKRFLSPDNFIQDPYNTQNFDRYGYVLNNPLIYTDPSGEAIFGLILGLFLKGAALAVGMNMLSNAIQGNPLHWGIGKAAVIGGISGVITAGIGKGVDSMFKVGINGPTLASELFRAGMHGFYGGISSAIQGGDFASGFLSSFVASAISSGVKEGLGYTTNAAGERVESNFSQKPIYDAIVIASGGLSGGFSASISGGNFWQGATQGAIIAGLNHLHETKNSRIGQKDGGKKICPTCPDLTKEFDEQLLETKEFFTSLSEEYDKKIEFNKRLYKNDPIIRRGIASQIKQEKLIQFKEYVKTGAKFDIKNVDGGKGTFGRITIRKGAYYNGRYFRYDDFGNYNFGVAARSYGYSLNFVKFGAGLYQIRSGTSKWEYFTSWFDDPRDSMMIENGYNHIFW